ncbi:MAG: AI-2E family transporter, partial [Armatimonadota bacterium]
LVGELRYLTQGASAGKERPSIIPNFLREPLRQQLRRVSSAVPAAISRATAYLIGSVSSLLWLLVVPLVTLYMMLDLPKIGQAVRHLVPSARRDEAGELAAEIARVFAGYIRGVVAVAVMNGIATGLVLWALGVPKPLVLGIIAGVLYPVPYVGALTSLTVACLVTLFAHGLARMLWVLGAMVFLNQFVFDQFVLPRVLGGAVGLHPIISIFAMVAAGHLFGVAGVILAVPAAASIATVLHHLYPRLFPALAQPDRGPEE